MSFYQLLREQKIPASLDEIWAFISSPANLKLITPDYMGFEITSNHLPGKMYPGMIISYRVSPIPGIKTTWVSEITHIEENKYFVDEQRIGPYRLWHHQHILDPCKNGVIMKDIITYQPPMGIMGNITNRIFIKDKLNEIFDYREFAIEKIFGTLDVEETV